MPRIKINIKIIPLTALIDMLVSNQTSLQKRKTKTKLEKLDKIETTWLKALETLEAARTWEARLSKSQEVLR